jgi:hypothetical protein
MMRAIACERGKEEPSRWVKHVTTPVIDLRPQGNGFVLFAILQGTRRRRIEFMLHARSPPSLAFEAYLQGGEGVCRDVHIQYLVDALKQTSTIHTQNLVTRVG